MIGEGPGSMLESHMQEKAAAGTRERQDGGLGQVLAREEEASSVGTGPTYLLGRVGCLCISE